MNLKDLIADVNVKEIYEHIETETLSEWVNAWQKAALTALRPVSRERVERMRGDWIIPTIIGGRAYNIPHCSACNGVPCGTDENTKFCANCGAPMTDEAVAMMMERWEALNDATD